jgi:RNA polymerase sigma-70 factor (ECF subfamily)
VAATAGSGGPTFEEEALAHLDAVYRFALRLSRSADRAEDLVQETFLRAFRGWDQYTPGTRCKSWLFTICRNVFLRQWERGQRHERAVRELSDDGPGDVINPLWAATAGTDPEGRFFDTLVESDVLREIEALPVEYRLVVLLSDLEELSYQEIAELLDLPLGTVKSRLFRGRRRLQAGLYTYAQEMGYIRRVPGADGITPPLDDTTHEDGPR